MTEEEIKDMIYGLRLEYGDTDPIDILLQDSEYRYLIDKYKGQLNVISKQVCFALLTKLARTSVRERVGQEERFGNNAFENYLKVLEKKNKDPSFGAVAPLAYFGGTYRSVVEFYENSPEFLWKPLYRGKILGQEPHHGRRIKFFNGEVIEPYEEGRYNYDYDF